MDAHSVLLLDEYGQPLSTRLQTVLLPLAARLQRQFPTLNDDCTLTEVLEESGRRIAAREERKGPLDNVHAYAWVVVRRMAALRLRHDQWAVARATLTSAESEMALRRTPAGFATSEQIYNEILCKELLAHLSPIEQQIAKGKNAGQSADEIARGCGTSRRTISNAWRRLKRKMSSRAQGMTARPGSLDWKKSSPF
jgi:DNA-binding CsgD family transcriptional regulator